MDLPLHPPSSTRFPAGHLRVARVALAALCATLATAPLRPQSVDRAVDALIESYAPSTGRADDAIEGLLDAIEGAPRSPVTEMLFAQLGALLPLAEDPAALVGPLRTLAAREDLHGLGRNLALLVGRRLSRVLGLEPAPEFTDPYAAYATRWLAIGPFGDSGNFHDGVAFGPERSFPAPGETRPGRAGQPARSRALEREPSDMRVDFGVDLERPEGCHYGLHQTRAAVPTACYLEVVCGGSFELFLNGTRLATIDRLAAWPGEAVRIPATLDAGANHVLVKTNFDSGHAVGLRYVDALGRPLQGLEELPADAVHDRLGTVGDRPPAPEPFVDGVDVLARVAERSGEPAHLAVAALSSLRDSRTDLGLELLRAASAVDAPPPRVGLVLAQAWRAAETLPQEIRDAESRRRIEAAAAALAGHETATLEMARLLRGDDRREDAVRLLRARIDQGSGGPDTFDLLADLLGELEADAESELVRAEWMAAHPQDVRPRLWLAERRREAGSPRAALAMLEPGLTALPGHGALLAAASRLCASLGLRDRALTLDAARFVDAPESVAARRSRTGLLTELGDRAAAEDARRQLAADPRTKARELREIGRTLWATGQREAAAAILTESLARRPEAHDVRRLLERVSGQDDFPQLARFRWSEADIDARVRDFVATERDEGAPSTLVVDRMLVAFRADGSYVQEVHQLRRINDLGGVEAHEEANAAANADEVIRLRTIGTDGASYVPKRVEGTFAMPRLEPGAFVEELWREEFPAPEAGPWRSPPFLFQGADAPFLWSEFLVILPPGHPGSLRTRGLAADVERIELDDGSVALRVVQTDVPRLRPERMTPPLEELVPLAIYGEDQSPGAAARQIRAASRFRGRSSPWIEEAARAICDGIEGDAARARAIHAWVHEQIAVERGAADPTAILFRRQGPRFFLEVALLEASGVRVRHAAVASGNETVLGATPPLFGGDEDVSDPAARIEPTDGEPQWIFANLPRHAPLGFVPGAMVGAAAIFADDGSTARVPVGAGGLDAPGWTVDATLTLAEGGVATLDATLMLRDGPGYGLAQQVRDLDANRRVLVGRSLGAQLFEGWQVVAAELDPPATGQQFRARLTLRRRGVLQAAEDGRVQLPLPIPRSEAFQRYGDQGPRVHPLRLTGLTIERWSLTVDPGTAYRWVGLPPPAREVHPMVDYSLAFTPVDGDRIRIERSFALRPGTLPASQFGEWVERLRRIDQAEAGRIEFEAR